MTGPNIRQHTHLSLSFMKTFIKFLLIAAIFGGGWGMLYLLFKVIGG